jgi:phage shock protein C
VTHTHYGHGEKTTIEKEEEHIDPSTFHEEKSYRHLYRSGENRILAGVCGGVGEYLDIDPVVIRVIVAIGVIVSFGTFLLLYLLMWIIIPQNPHHSWK